MSPRRTMWFLSTLLMCSHLACHIEGEGEDSPIPEVVPRATITAPGQGAYLPLEALVTLQGQVTDVQSPPDAITVTWLSDVEGTLGTSRSTADGRVELDALFEVPGQQRITLRVTDGDGEVGEASVEVMINAPPTVQILSVEPDVPLFGEEVLVLAKVSDEEDDPRNLELIWTDDLGNVLGTSPADRNGDVELATRELEAGDRAIALVARDTTGDETRAVYSLTVIDCIDRDDDGWTDCDGDCDDESASVHPEAVEICDGLDQDCNGINDNGFPDADRDKIMDCVDTEECDGLDNDGDGLIDEGFPDNDVDGIPNCRDVETCDGIDNNGDGQIDEDTADTDGDGISDCQDACPGTGSSADDPDNDGRCNDADNCPSAANPDQRDGDRDGLGDACDTELCNGDDDDGDGMIDEGYDQDHDGFTTCLGDCDDGNASINPTIGELCDGNDNDCDGMVDEDPYEPNDTLSGALFLPNLNGVNEPAYFSLEASIHSSSDSDFYKIELVDDFAWGNDLFYVEVKLSHVPAGTNYDLYLWWDDPDDFYFSGTDNIRYSKNSGQQDEYLIHNGDSGPENGGSYWIEVRRVSGSSCSDFYLLEIENMG